MSRKTLTPDHRTNSAASRPDPTAPATLVAAVTVRRKKGITLEQIAERTKIAIRSLRAIEDGDFAKLPGGIYNTSYVRQYAQAIEFDEQELLAYYYRATGTAPAGTESAPGSGPRSSGFPPFGQRSAEARS